ncbi:MAG: glycogen-binding domain-containing protein [Planctomycetaceae bacterium]|nr:glycogen-binding domain-containing protein [Planctomycetaceae bacterium]
MAKKTVVAKTPVVPASNLKKVPLKVRAEGAREVVLTGDFTQWAKDKIRLTPTAGGEWITVLELAPGEYQYRLIVDGEWRDHSDAPKRIGNPFGTQNCVLVVA